MKKLMGIAILGLLFFVPACDSTQKKGTQSNAMKAELARQAQYYEARADSLDREASRLDKQAESLKDKAYGKRLEAKKCRAHAKKMKNGEPAVPVAMP